MTGNGILTIFHTKMKQVFEREIGTFVLFYKAWNSSPPFSLSQTMANRFHRVPTNIHIPWWSAFFLFLFLFFGIEKYGR
jgi:hypothetical protein